MKKSNEQKLKCLSSMCEHEFWDNTCLYNKLLDKESHCFYDELVKIIADEVKVAEAEIEAKYKKKLEGKKSGTGKKKSIQK